MKAQCDVCVQAAATLVCCADEAALCADCDTRVHAANKLAGKHERLPLSSDCSASPCDICQEKSGLFFCLEDRALLCRDCDLGIHTTNKLTRKHKRFLLSGVRVGLDAMAPLSLPSEAPSPHPHPSLLAAGLDMTTLSPTSPSLVIPSPLDSDTEDKPMSKVALMESTHQHPLPPKPSILERPKNTFTHQHPPPSNQSILKPPKNTFMVANTPMWENMHHVVPPPSASLLQSSTVETTNTLIPLHAQQASSSCMYFSNCLAQLDELLNGSPSTTTYNEIPSSMMGASNLGWGVLDNAFAWDVLHTSNISLFENSLAEVPSTPLESLNHINNKRRRRNMQDEPLYSSTCTSMLDHTLVVPTSTSTFPLCKQGRHHL